MSDFISRESIKSRFTKRLYACNHGSICEACYSDAINIVDEEPAADVRPVAEISDAVDEVLDFLNENSNCMPYHIYSALFDLVSGICPKCGADMREVER